VAGDTPKPGVVAWPPPTNGVVGACGMKITVSMTPLPITGGMTTIVSFWRAVGPLGTLAWPPPVAGEVAEGVVGVTGVKQTQLPCSSSSSFFEASQGVLP